MHLYRVSLQMLVSGRASLKGYIALETQKSLSNVFSSMMCLTLKLNSCRTRQGGVHVRSLASSYIALESLRMRLKESDKKISMSSHEGSQC